MHTSIFLAQTIGIVMLVMSMTALTRPRIFLNMISEFANNEFYVFFSGIVLLVVGAILVVCHNVWTRNWTLIITLVAWFALINGIVRVYLPELFGKLMGKVLLHPIYLRFVAGILFLVSISLLYFGFSNR